MPSAVEFSLPGMPLDIGIGIISAIFVSYSFSLPLTAPLVASGIIFALLMDIDLLLHFILGGTMRNSYRHRDILHYPLVYIPIGTAAAFYFAGGPFATLFFVASIAHFIHDSIGLGWGVAWLWPFSTHRFSFFYMYQPRHKKPMPRRFVYVWPQRQIEELEKEYGDPDVMTHLYWQLHPYAIVEFAFLILSVIALLLYVG